MNFAGEVFSIYGEAYGEIFEDIKDIGNEISKIFDGLGGTGEGVLSLISGAVKVASMHH